MDETNNTFQVGDRVVVMENNVNAYLGKAEVLNINYQAYGVTEESLRVRYPNLATCHVPSRNVKKLRFIPE